MPTLPLDLRKYLPSGADPEEREKRKQLEKTHGIGFMEVALLGMLGATLAWDIEKQVKEHEERHEKRKAAEAKQRRRDDRHRDREHERRSRSAAGYTVASGDSRRSERVGSDRDAPPRHRSIDYRGDAWRDDQCRERAPQYEARDDPRHSGSHDDSRYSDRGRGSR
ncbi:hypothetical protein SAMD00023353_0200480 [Rosellinia necatrix]|uniref:Uncharacterized protein n=1 Tax=Rosellinia necatrix TaxID=77044 RepID=A0A1S7UJX5_ROSNE|nr:hypothetical protein SAMD00023353_0200480 [Rosellinia necatrix]